VGCGQRKTSCPGGEMVTLAVSIENSSPLSPPNPIRENGTKENKRKKS